MISLLVCLIPTTIGGLLSAIGIAGMDRVMQHNVLAMSGKAVEAAGDVNTLLLIASTLCCITRSMPAMPMAESSPPIVVGIRHTSSETSTGMLGGFPAPAAVTE